MGKLIAVIKAVTRSLQYLLKALKKLNLFIGNENDSLKIFANILLKTIVFQYTTIDKIVVIDKKKYFFFVV